MSSVAKDNAFLTGLGIGIIGVSLCLALYYNQKQEHEACTRYNTQLLNRMPAALRKQIREENEARFQYERSLY